MRNFPSIVVASALLLLLPLLSSASAATPEWMPPEALGSGGANSIRMDVNAAGAAVAVWSTPQEIKVSYRPAGRDWQNPVVLDEEPGVLLGAFIDDGGEATAVWEKGRAL